MNMVKMNKTLSFMILGVMTILMLGAVSASTTIIAGKIYNSDYTAIIQGADVTVTCDGNMLTTTSGDDGAYKVQYTNVCVDGNSLTVYAEKDSLTGSKTGTVKETCGPSDKDNNCLIEVLEGTDVAIVNVPLVPEFGTVVGVLTALSAVGVFFFVRKK
jgi:hypothetical protein